MQFTPKVSDFDFERPSIKVYKLSQQLVFNKAVSEQKIRRSRAISDILDQPSKQMDFKEEIKKLEQIEKPQELKREIFRQIKQTCREFRNVERERDGSLWVKSFCTNEKIQLSKLFQGTQNIQTIDYKKFHSRRNSKVVIIAKKKEVEVPKLSQLLQRAQQQQSKPRPSQIRLRLKSKNLSQETIQEQEIFTERECQVNLATHKIDADTKKPNKEIDGQNMKEFDEMLQFYNQDRIVKTSQYIIRRRIDYKKILHELKKKLQYVSRLNLDIFQAFSDQVISQKPFQKEHSYEFIQAAKQGKEFEVKEFIKDNKYLVYDFDYIYMTALHWACKRGHFEIVRLLVENGADIEFQDIIGRPTLYFAIIGRSAKIVKYILDKRADPWSTTAVNYNQLCLECDPSFQQLISQARKVHITLKMTAPSQRETIWRILRR
ncbi:unnamed protein product (macronuclear) [Paramecium tetraurelia]|uniref:Uncharacterized protein n=1 Tax=Paramecium tetraurelia TaxID=5888 RepID=A0DM60_PARTE|nr:uncharacterized protein GSPATT00018345001 [Paramecium tetraurelia]CAK84127.1 unnamed protein product [Paramecium tetraurelia]|eukprot:XP_001451524.1 hypothetical protein (macronuclear) [Paramecium tetraurelia strain d4-2]